MTRSPVCGVVSAIRLPSFAPRKKVTGITVVLIIDQVVVVAGAIAVMMIVIILTIVLIVRISSERFPAGAGAFDSRW